MDQTNVALPSEAVEALENGRMIQAIKIVRERSGMGLKEAKDTVDRYLAAHPDLRERCARAGAQGSLVAGLVLALLGLAVLGLFVWLKQR
jgi:hypothetical protein